jgi:5-methylcytosine-specific restriction enzyme subunit McrC
MRASRPRLELTEWEDEEIHLSPSQASALASCRADLDVTPSEAAGVYRVSPTSTVGALSGPEFELLIRPKIDVDRVFQLLGYVEGYDVMSEPAALERVEEITEAFAEAFVAVTERAFTRHVVSGYQPRDEVLLGVRGRIRFADQLRRHQSLPIPTEVTYDDYTIDTPENRLIKYALTVVTRLPALRSPVRRRAMRLIGVLEGVADVRFVPSTLPEITRTRLNRHYRTAPEMAALIARSSSVELRPGQEPFSSFLIDMNSLFEEFLFKALAERLQGLGSWLRGTPVSFDTAGLVRMEPDLSLWQGSDCTFVGDAKYKATSVGSADDLYQLLAYCQVLGLGHGILFYGAAFSEVEHEVETAGTRLRITSVDLALSWSELQARLDELADLVRATSALSAVQTPVS